MFLECVVYNRALSSLTEDDLFFLFLGEVLRKRGRRTAFSNEQLDRLEGSFEQERFPGIQTREELARELSIGEDRIQVRCLRKAVLVFPGMIHRENSK